MSGEDRSRGRPERHRRASAPGERPGMTRRAFGRKVAVLGGGLLAIPGGALARARSPAGIDGTPLEESGAAAAGAAPPGPGARPGSVEVNRDRLLANFEELKQFGGGPGGRLDRTAYSDADLAAREFVTELMREAGLEPRVDVAGNLIGRREGGEDLPPLLFGSHTDSVPAGGHYDGQVGSMGAVEVAHALRDAGIETRHPLEVVIFQNEEGGLYGSRMMGGGFEREELSIEAASGYTIEEGTRRLGGDPDRLEEARRGPGEVAAYLELHIEQGGILDTEGIDIGVVQGIVGIRWWEVDVEGFANHAGTTPMDQRQDALLAAARYVQAVHEVIRGHPGPQVGTVGRISAEPGAPNVIPGRVRTSLEIRDLEMETIQALHEEIRREAERIGEETGTRFAFELTVDLEPAPVDEEVQDRIAEAAGELGLSSHRMPSGAGHDAQSLARIAPIGMIFVPSVDGISHSPEEFTHPDDIVNGANVLLRSILSLDGSP